MINFFKKLKCNWFHHYEERPLLCNLTNKYSASWHCVECNEEVAKRLCAIGKHCECCGGHCYSLYYCDFYRIQYRIQSMLDIFIQCGDFCTNRLEHKISIMKEYHYLINRFGASKVDYILALEKYHDTKIIIEKLRLLL